MRRQLLGFTLVLLGLLALGVAVGPAPTPVAAMPALQPSPRPTIAPTSEGDINYGETTPVGRITGTVIDLRTGAPAPGKTVRIGDKQVTTDSNGNYDLWVDKGQYEVSLTLPEVEGVAAQNVTLATVWGDDTVVVHLFYIGPEAASAPAVVEPAPAPTVAPAAVVVQPNPPVEQPASLPVTGNELLDPQAVALGGLALLALGGVLMLLPRRAPARVAVSAGRVLKRRRSAEDLLRELLRRDP